MREILFRGKCLDNGTWAEGSLSMEYFHECGCVMISPTSGTCYKVEPETVGQFTGMTDKNDVKIFESDICLFDDELMVVEWYDEDAMFFLRSLDGTNWTTNFSMVAGNELEVIGNIHDNPELLEVGVDGN